MDYAADKKTSERALTSTVPGNADGKASLYIKDNRPQSAIKEKQVKALSNKAVDKKPVQKKANNTGLPDNLKSGIENLSGHAMDDVKVHYNSSQPAQLNAHAYAQGSAIHLAPGQEKHLPHEAWHVVQQKQGRVRPTMQLKGKVNVNDDKGLEKEADVMGAKALSIIQTKTNRTCRTKNIVQRQVVQRVLNELQQATLERLQKADTGPDEALREEAKKLLAEVADVDKAQIRPLIGKFSAVKEKKKAGPSAAAVPSSSAPSSSAAGPKQVEVAPKGKWEWSAEQKAAAKLFHQAQSVLMDKAFEISKRVHPKAVLAPDPIEDVLRVTTEVPVVSYHTGKLAGLGLWTGLLNQLRSSDGKNRIHVIQIDTIDGRQINITLSEHASHGSKAPDYLVHDSRAELYMHSTSGVQQASPTHDPRREERLSAQGDTLTVSYAAFAGKITTMKAQQEVNDAKIAEWMLMIIMSPSIATAAITREAPEIEPHQISLMYELVATWMLAEPARHKSSMISGIIELENIEAGRKTFAQALSQGPVGHPMAHIGSEAQGRRAEADERNVSTGAKKPNPQSPVNIKQKQQLDDTYGPHAKRELIELIKFYTNTVEDALMLDEDFPLTDDDIDAAIYEHEKWSDF